MLKLIETLVGPPRFLKLERVEHDLACPHCKEKMVEKGRSFGFKAEESLWEHLCPDGITRKIRPTEEQEKQAAQFKRRFKA